MFPRFLLTEPRIVGLDLSPAAPGLPQDGQNGRAVIFQYASGVPAPGRYCSCGSPHTQASRPNFFKRGLAPSRRYR